MTQAAAWALGEQQEPVAALDVLPGDGVRYAVPQQVDPRGEPGPVGGTGGGVVLDMVAARSAGYRPSALALRAS